MTGLIDRLESSSRPCGHFSPPAFAPALAQHTIPVCLLPFSATVRLLRTIYEALGLGVVVLILASVDSFIFIVNLFTPRKRAGAVIPCAFSPSRPPSFLAFPVTHLFCRALAFIPPYYQSEFLLRWTSWRGIGAGGRFGVHDPPHVVEGLSRGCCPALNAMANHGILPRDGRRLSPHQVAVACSLTYNLSATVSYALLVPFAALWQGRGWFDLEDLSLHPLQHDGSLAREDINSPYAYATVVGTQGKPSQRLLGIYFPSVVSRLSYRTHARLLGHARLSTRNSQGGFTLSLTQALFASFKSSLLHLGIGPLQATISEWLGGNDSAWERFPNGWEPFTRSRWGITLVDITLLALLIEATAGPWSTQPRMVLGKQGFESAKGWNPNLGQCRNVLQDVEGSEGKA